MVSETAVFIVGNNEEDLIPLRTAAKGIVDLSQELLTTVNGTGRVETFV
jgi:hypothetical protein